MTKFNLQNPIFIITIICFLTAIAISALFSFPKFQEFKVIRENIATKEQAIQKEESYFLDIQRHRERMGEYQEQLSIIDSALPDDAEISLPFLFRFLQTTSAQTGLILTEIGPFTISPVEGKDIKKTQFSFQANGAYASLKAFLEVLEKSARIIRVENISFSMPEEGGLFSFDIKIAVYSHKELPGLPRKELKVDYEVLGLPILEKLEPFPDIEPFEAGRENPFVPF